MTRRRRVSYQPKKYEIDNIKVRGKDNRGCAVVLAVIGATALAAIKTKWM